jgi:hypothetical protein
MKELPRGFTAWWTCDRCGTETDHTELNGEGLLRYPDGWRGIAGKLLCDDCQKSFDKWLYNAEAAS